MAGTLAIDLGSSTTVVAYQAPGEAPQVLALPPYSLGEPAVVPSLLWLASVDQPRALLGRQVLEAGLALQDSPQLHRDFKRLIGNPHAARMRPQPDDAGLPLPAEAAGARLLQQIWAAVPQHLAPERLVLSAPIDTYQGYRSWLQQASANLAVEDIALVDEPTAAAIGCGLPAGSTVLVVDLGGGTCDLSLVRLEGGEGRARPIAQLLRLGGRDLLNSRQQLRCARVLGKAGLAIGGRDIDRWIARWLCPDAAPSGTLLAAAEQLKCRLSDGAEARTIHTGADGRSQELLLSRQALSELLQRRGLIDQLDALLEAVLAQGRAAGIDRDGIDAVLPVGGSSRLAAVHNWLHQRLGAIPIHNRQPVEAVALGALALTPGVKVRDVLSQGVSLRCWDRRSGRHHWHPLYVPGQSWPTEHPLDLVLACSRERQRTIELVLGEPLPQQRGEVVFVDGMPQLRQRPAGAPPVQPWLRQPEPLPLDPPGVAGEDRLQLRFRVDETCRLWLAVRDLCRPEAEPEERVLGLLR